MEKIKEVKFTDGSIGIYYTTGNITEGMPEALFFWEGDKCPTALCLNQYDYRYTHGGKTYQEACKEWPERYSQAYY